MSESISVSTQSLKKVKLVEIDGVSFKVRRFGAGEQLSVMQLQRQVKELSSLSKLTDEQEGKMVDLSRSLLDIVSGLFDDMQGGKETKLLMQRIDLEDMQLILEQIFKENRDDAAKEVS